MGAKLDRSRPYGTIHEAEGGGMRACYEQDYKQFDTKGDEIVATAIAGGKVDDGTGPQPVLVSKDAQGNLMKDGETLDTEAMNAEELHTLAASMGMKLHPMTGKAKTLVAITAAAVPVDQVAAQLGD